MDIECKKMSDYGGLWEWVDYSMNFEYFLVIISNPTYIKSLLPMCLLRGPGYYKNPA